MNPKFIIDEAGNPISVILSIEDYNVLLKAAAKKDSTLSSKERFPLRGKPTHYEQPFSGVDLQTVENSKQL